VGNDTSEREEGSHYDGSSGEVDFNDFDTGNDTNSEADSGSHYDGSSCVVDFNDLDTGNDTDSEADSDSMSDPTRESPNGLNEDLSDMLDADSGLNSELDLFLTLAEWSEGVSRAKYSSL
jgi:hypothetical protein